MVAFVPNYQYDFFVSYAHVDDTPMFDAERWGVPEGVGRLTRVGQGNTTNMEMKSG